MDTNTSKHQEVLVHRENPHEHLPIFIYPNSKLREKAQPVTDFGEEFQAIIGKMANTMYAAGGIGLAATQVGLALDLFILDLSPGNDHLEVFVNTVIDEAGGKVTNGEGCLSFPGVLEDVERAAHILGSCQDRHGNKIAFDYSGLEAVAVQHEMDHLKGVLLFDKVSRLKQRYIKKTVGKFVRQLPGR